ncbi:MAG: Alanyl dipeptidyl peptidase [uncultured Sphingomonas sp.]|uniref:Alanyl dipeptidyl peptidase n=1 Tax=uncultured Sphingomonas sp. TaxID=158754 RepID=A0A6J4TBT7_9SPHN|nr:S9 family peptidase [uncultured Sphingomonas sp.]CAA9518424.1 MAG: Alanyl dipeptidyl peptidase [uncultured Sphingomonas sp.]
MKKHAFLAAAAFAAFALPTAAAARPMTATDMHTMRRLGAAEVSPDGRTAVFSLSTTDLPANKRNNTLTMLDLTRRGATLQPVPGVEGGHSATWGPDGALYFLKAVGERDQLHRMPLGGQAVAISDFGADISGFKIAPTGDRVIVWADRPDCPDLPCAATTLPAKPGGTGQVFDELFVRHWDTWVEPGVRSRIYSFPVENDRLTGMGVRVTGNLVGDTPSKPFGGGEEIAFSRDGRTVYFALREAGRVEATSTNLDIFAAPADGSAPPTNLTDPNDGTDTLPTVSPDGRTLAYVAMARPGYESDRQVLMLRDLASGQVRPLTGGWDRSVGSIAWAPDARSIVVDAQDTLDNPLFRVDVGSGRVTRLTGDGTAHNARVLRDGSVLYTLNTVHKPDDLHRVDRRGRASQLTAVNRELLAELDPVSFERFSFAGANNDRVWGIKVKPQNARGKLPIAFVVHGGPQGSSGNGWSYRWNPRVFASPGYGVVSVDFHGSTGYGQAFTDSITRDWGGKPLQDLKLGLAHAVATDPQLDRSRACALGASYGGYMAYWIAGQWPDGFNCLVSHNGVFDTRSMGFMTEELWFTEQEFGGTPYDVPQEYERWNPLLHVSKWKTPMLVVIGDRDYRIPYPQGIAAFTALQRRGVPSRLLRFPDENHWVLKPKNSIQWYGEVQGWLDKYTGSAGTVSGQQ